MKTKIVAAIIPTVSLLQTVTGQEIHSEVPFFLEDEILKCKRVIVAFKQNIIPTERGVEVVDTTRYPILDSATRALLADLSSRYGAISIRKTFPLRVWGDTIVANKRTGVLSVVPDMSNVFAIDFSALLPIDSVISAFQSLPVVRYAERPIIIAPLVEPNDPEFGSQWNLQRISAPNAWDITVGSSDVPIAIVDIRGAWLEYNHEDFQIPGGHKYVYHDGETAGWHALATAGVASASTNNSLGVAGVSWNSSLLGYHFDEDEESGTRLPTLIDHASDPELGNADVISFSFVTLWFSFVTLWIENNRPCPHHFVSVEAAIARAAARGVVLVAAAGNGSFEGCSNGQVPFEAYPAAYPEVIAVTATDQSDEFVDSWNYGPAQNDFVDVSAPGTNMRTIYLPPDQYGTFQGTSFSAPQVAGLTSLMLSINPSLSTTGIKSVIEQTADKVGQYPYINGRNQYMGFGRINAYKAVLLALASVNKSTLSIATAYGSTRKTVYDSGKWHVVFQTENKLVHAFSTNDGSSWTDHQFINGSATLGPSSNPSLSVHNNKLHTVFLNTSDAIYYNRATTAGVWEWQEPRLLTNIGSATTGISSIVDASGIGHVVFVHTNEVLSTTVYYLRHGMFNTADALPSLANLTIVTSSSSPISLPSVGFDSNNKPHVVWQQNSEIYYSNKISASWISPENVSGTSTESAVPSVYVQGTAVHAVWEEENTSGNWEVYYRKRSGSWGSISNISDNSGTSVEPFISGPVIGDALVVWADNTSSSYYNIKYKLANSGGVGSFRTTSAHSHHPTFTPRPVNTVLVLWTDGSASPFVVEDDRKTFTSPEGPEGKISLRTEKELIPEKYALHQNTPNPFNPSTVIRYELPEDVFISLKVYDLLGREVETLVDETKHAGYYELMFDASSLGSGVYLYRLTTLHFTRVRKMLIMK